MNKYFFSIGFFAIGSVSTYGQATRLASSKIDLPPQETKPNILWLTYEDTSPEFIGCYGNKQARTPNIDKLANDGVRFGSAFSTAAVSSASRSCIITGVSATTLGTGNHRSSYKISKEIEGFPYYLKQAGYYTTNNSKTDYNIANAKEFTQRAWDESSNNADWQKRKPGQPFFSIYNSAASHQSRTMTNTWGKYEEQVLKQLEPDEIVKEGNLEIPDFYRDSPKMQKHMSRVYNSITLMDKEFGQWLNKLEADGLKDSTIVFCFSDHGEGITRAKGSAFGIGYQVPFIIWIPAMYKHLSPWGDGVFTDELISFEDLAPTMLHLAGLQVPDYMKGRVFMGTQTQPERKYVFSGVDRTDESSELSRSVTDGKYLYTRVFMPFQPFVRWNMYYEVSDLQQTIRSDYKKGLLNHAQSAMLEPRQAEYLFNLQTDKWETINLINRPEFKLKINELRNALVDNIIRDRDSHFMTEYVFKQSDKTPVELASDKDEYPIEKILETALLVGRDKTVIAQQIEQLSNPNPYIRYWAAIGLFSQKSNLRKYTKYLESKMSEEEFEPVKNTLAVLLYKIDSEKYLPSIKAILQENDAELLRMSLNLLITLDQRKQQLFLNDIKLRLEINKRLKIKGMFACNDYMTLFIHKLEGLPIHSDDSF